MSERYAAVALLVLVMCGVWQIRQWALAGIDKFRDWLRPRA